MINKDMIQDVYSTEEVKTNKVWIDGKPLYRKTFYKSGKPTFTSNKYSFTHGISNMGIPIRIYGVCFDITNQTWFTLPYPTRNGTASIMLYNDTSTITVEQDSYGSSRLQEFYITLEYTKTTD